MLAAYSLDEALPYEQFDAIAVGCWESVKPAFAAASVDDAEQDECHLGVERCSAAVGSVEFPPDLVVPVDRRWTGMFFQLHPSEWQDPLSQHRTFLQMYRDFCEFARQAQPQRYVDGRLWRTSRTKIIDNGFIGFCTVELAGEPGEQTTDGGKHSRSGWLASHPPGGRWGRSAWP